MSLTKVLSNIGDENISYQNLQNSIKTVKTKKLESEITFYTDQLNANQWLSDSGKVGLVVWVDKGDLSNEIQKLNKDK